MGIGAYTEAERTITLPAGSSLTAGQYRFVAVSASGNVNLVAASGGLQVDGVCYNKPEAGQAATVVIQGIAKVVAGGAITNGAAVVSDSGGAAVAAASGATNMVAGRALRAATGAGAVIPVLLAVFRPTVTG